MIPTHIMIPAWENGKLTPVEKLEAHQRGLRHLAVSVFVICKGAILIQQRALNKYHTPGLWANTVCTHPNWDEPAQACALRRLGEELGITGIAPEHRGEVEYRADVGNGLIEHEVVQVFRAFATSDIHIAANPDEVMATRWIMPDQLVKEITLNPEAFTPWLRIYLAKHADLILG